MSRLRGTRGRWPPSAHLPPALTLMQLPPALTCRKPPPAPDFGSVWLFPSQRTLSNADNAWFLHWCGALCPGLALSPHVLSHLPLYWRDFLQCLMAGRALSSTKLLRAHLMQSWFQQCSGISSFTGYPRGPVPRKSHC